jgi:hypothetical protein
MVVINKIKFILEDRLNNQFEPLFNENEISSFKIKYEEGILNIFDEAKGKHVIYHNIDHYHRQIFKNKLFLCGPGY